MDKINIEGVILTPLKKITHPRGEKKQHGRQNTYWAGVSQTLPNKIDR